MGAALLRGHWQQVVDLLLEPREGAGLSAPPQGGEGQEGETGTSGTISGAAANGEGMGPPATSQTDTYFTELKRTALQCTALSSPSQNIVCHCSLAHLAAAVR